MSDEKKELKVEDLKKSLKLVDIIIAMFILILVKFFILVSISLNEIILAITAYALFIPAPFLLIYGVERHVRLEKELKKLGVPTEDDEMIEQVRKRMRELNE